MALSNDKLDGTPVVYVKNLNPGQFRYVRQFLFVGEGTDLLELAAKLAEFDAKFFKDVGIVPYDTSARS